MRIRGFERVIGYDQVVLPERKTQASAGYDLASAEKCVIQPGEIKLICTGIKAYMPENEFLQLFIRSSMAVKRGLSLINGTGIVDADYYNNPENEGHIMVAVINHGVKAVTIEQGERIAQGIFSCYGKTDTDIALGERIGGFGSTQMS